jgi:hypothetical protein
VRLAKLKLKPKSYKIILGSLILLLTIGIGIGFLLTGKHKFATYLTTYSSVDINNINLVIRASDSEQDPTSIDEASDVSHEQSLDDSPSSTIAQPESPKYFSVHVVDGRYVVWGHIANHSK